MNHGSNWQYGMISTNHKQDILLDLMYLQEFVQIYSIQNMSYDPFQPHGLRSLSSMGPFQDPLAKIINELGDELGNIVPLPHSTISKYFNGAEFSLFCIFTIFLAMPIFHLIFKRLGYSLKRENIWDLTHDMGNVTLLMLWVYVFANEQVTFELTSFISFYASIMIFGFMTQQTISPKVTIIIDRSCSAIGIILALISIKNHIYYHRMLGENLITMEFVVPLIVVSWLGYRYYLYYFFQNAQGSSGTQSTHDADSWKVYLALSLLTQSHGWFSSIFTGFALGGFIHAILSRGF